ncbi:MAG: glycosyltransferase [Deltaproteobacteria bacterium]|nr:glycosyltransferase [Deltaproteobacteria bacterium]
MLLSLVTPSLNQAGFLRQCVDNVRRLGPAVEHIVSDGASTDGTLALLARACGADGLPLRHASAPDRGMYDALNSGFALARGEILGYLNCDDLLLPWAIETVVAAFQRRPDIDLVYGDAIEWRPDHDRCTLVVQPPAPLLQTYLERGGHLAQPAVFFRRRLFERLGGFDGRFRLLGDHAFWLRALGAGARCVKTWECLAIQRMVPGQLMDRFSTAVETERAEIQRLLDIRPPSSSDRRYVRRLYALQHRLAIAGLALQLATPDALARRQWLPWQRTARSRFFEFASAAETRRALLGSTRDRRYLRPTAAGQRALLPDSETVAP